MFSEAEEYNAAALCDAVMAAALVGGEVND
jgi:hypothetical protein